MDEAIKTKSKHVDKLAKEYKDLKHKLLKQSIEYENLTKDANRFQTRYNTEILPQALKILEALERKRMQTVKAHFQTYNSFLDDLIKQIKSIQDTACGKFSSQLDENDAINDFIGKITSSHGKAGEVSPPIEYDLPTRPEYIEADFFVDDGNLPRLSALTKTSGGTLGGRGVPSLRAFRRNRGNSKKAANLADGSPDAVKDYFQSKYDLKKSILRITKYW